MSKGYPDIQPTESFHLPVGDGHELYVEVCGNPEGIPVLYIHGGPGGYFSNRSSHFFNPEKYRIVLFDQRGTGRSKPFLSLENNTVLASVGDMEVLRKRLNIDQWILFGGSYGSTLSLAYAIHHPQRCMHMVLRGIFLGRQEDVAWLFQSGADNFYPEEFAKYKNHIKPELRGNLVSAYYDLMLNEDEEISRKASKIWADWENSILKLKDNSVSEEIQPVDLSGSLLEAHYFVNKMFWDEDDYILNRIDIVQDIPTDIFHGRFDVDCRIKGAYDLKEAMPKANLIVVQPGCHYPFESPMYEMMIDKMDELAEVYS